MKNKCSECGGKGEIWIDIICQTIDCKICQGVGVYDCDYNCDDEGLYEVNIDGADVMCECPEHYENEYFKSKNK